MIDSVVVKFRGPKAPSYQTPGSAGCDIISNEDVVIYPASVKLISTGLYVEIPKGYEGQVRSRSGLATRGLFVLNSPGTIDSDYRGEVKVILMNSSVHSQFIVSKGDRIAQLVIAPVIQAVFEHSDELSQTSRGEAGFGSTGI